MLFYVVDQMLRMRVIIEPSDEEELIVTMLKKVISNEKPEHLSDDVWDRIKHLLRQLDGVLVDACITESIALIFRLSTRLAELSFRIQLQAGMLTPWIREMLDNLEVIVDIATLEVTVDSEAYRLARGGKSTADLSSCVRLLQ